MTIQDRIHIRKCYNSLLKGSNEFISPYSIMDWNKEMSPIEFETWKIIRGIGMPFMPEFPVYKYFLDFANPLQKIGIECDSFMYHKDKIKDLKRDAELYKFGWKIFRITGSECNFVPKKSLSEILNDEQYYNLDISCELEDFFMNSIDGVLEAINILYFNGIPGFKHVEYAIETLKQHRLINFTIDIDGDMPF